MNTLIIKNSLGRELSSIEEWRDGFIEVDGKPMHWKEGYSAHSLAKFFIEKGGEKWLSDTLRVLLGTQIQYNEAEIEHASKVDSFQGGQRMQDLAIWGLTGDGKSVFVGIEAKVLETFDKTIEEAITEAKKTLKTKPTSNGINRINGILEYLFPGKALISVKHLRYQLSHYFVGGLREAPSLSISRKQYNEKRPLADIVVLPVLAFQTKHYEEDPNIGENNKKDYLNFCESIDGMEHLKNSSLKNAFHKTVEGREFYTFYETIPL